MSKILNEPKNNLKNIQNKKNNENQELLKQTNDLVEYYSSLISQQMKMRWSLPSSARKSMVSEVKITVLPSGDIITVDLSLSSGDRAFDQSTLLAVKKAGRFEFMRDIPHDIFEKHFREFTFRFIPEDL